MVTVEAEFADPVSGGEARFDEVWDCVIACLWSGRAGELCLVAVNYAANQSQCYVRLPLPNLDDRSVRFKDLMGSPAFDREGSDLASRGLYLDMRAWGYHVFELIAL